MRISILLTMSFVFQSGLLICQDYFQQKVNHQITASLDTTNHLLSAKSVIQYYNNSPDSLNELIFHVWMNAFYSKRSAFARQKIDMVDGSFHFVSHDQRGGYQKLDFVINGNSVEPHPYVKDGVIYSDIVILKLNKPITPQSITQINIDFVVKMPYAFSRPGIKDHLYRMTQWYPKPAVYDREGWHPMPYLEIGEYYSEYGDYKVNLDLPLSFSVASTGVPVESTSKLDLENRRRLIQIEANDVHDFAWFASEYYIPYRESVDINGKKVIVNLFVKEDNSNWTEVMKLSKRALSFLCEQISTYPYDQITVVESSEEDGSGMEYPMITILNIGDNDQHTDHLIVHEFAHQWFYGILGSNERDEPWIDEGFSNYFDRVYDDYYYDASVYDQYFGDLNHLPIDGDFNFLDEGVREYERIAYGTSIKESISSSDALNYMSNNYAKTSGGIFFLRAYLGKSLFNKAIQRLFRHWSFKHPNGKDVQEVFESVSGKELNWFFDDYLNKDGRYDIKIAKHKKNEVIIKRNMLLNVPVHLSIYQKAGQFAYSSWYESNGMEEQSLSIPDGEFGSFSINEGMELYEVNTKNNRYSKRKKFTPKLRMVNILESTSRNTIGLFPHLFYNKSDGLMLGTSLYSAVFPQQDIRYLFSPSYAFGSERFTYVAAVEKDFYFDKKQTNNRKITVTLNSRRFGYFESEETFPLSLAYTKINPSASLHFARDVFHYSSLSYEWNFIRQDLADFEDNAFKVRQQNYSIHRLNYRKMNLNALRRTHLDFEVQYENYERPFDRKEHYVRTMLTVSNRINYSVNHSFFIRFNAAYFPINTQRNSSSYSSIFTRGSIALGTQAYTDQGFDDYYFDRMGNTPSQITERFSGFKTAFGPGQSIGMSNDYSFAVNVKIDLPINLPGEFKLRPYFDIAGVRTKSLASEPLKMKAYSSGGLALEIADFIGIYLPLLNSGDLELAYSSDNIFSRVSFKLNLSALNIWKVSDQPAVLWDQ